MTSYPAWSNNPDNAVNATVHSPTASLYIPTFRAVASVDSTSSHSSDSLSADSEDTPSLDPNLLNELVQHILSDLSVEGFHLDISPRATERIAAVLSPAISVLIARSVIPNLSASKSFLSIPERDVTLIRDLLLTAAHRTQWLSATDRLPAGLYKKGIPLRSRFYRLLRKVASVLLPSSSGGSLAAPALATPAFKAPSSRGMTSPRFVRHLLPKSSVFLGGTCCGTTWRREVAIPYLKEHRIPFYDPMVASWTPLQLEREERAKCHSSVFLFNITRDARSLASMLEIAFLTGKGAPIVSAISTESIIPACGGCLSPEENRVMQALREELIARAETRGYPIFTRLEDALKFVDAIVNSRLFVNEVVSELGYLPLTPVLNNFSSLLSDELLERSPTADFSRSSTCVMSKKGLHGGQMLNKLSASSEPHSIDKSSEQSSSIREALSPRCSFSRWLHELLHGTLCAAAFDPAKRPKSGLLSSAMQFALDKLLRKRKHQECSSADGDDRDRTCTADIPKASTSTGIKSGVEKQPLYDLFVNSSAFSLDLHTIFGELNTNGLSVLTWSQDELLNGNVCSIPKQCIPRHACLPDTPSTPASLSSSTSSSSFVASSSTRFKWPRLKASCTTKDAKHSKLADTFPQASKPLEAYPQPPKCEVKLAANPFSILHERPPTRSTRRRRRNSIGHRFRKMHAKGSNSETNVQALPERQDSRSSSTTSSSGSSDALGFESMQTHDTPPPTPTSMECDSGLSSPMSMVSALQSEMTSLQFFSTPSSSQEDLHSASCFASSGAISPQGLAPAGRAVTSIHVVETSSPSARREQLRLQLKSCSAFLFAFTRRSTAVLDAIFAAEFFGEESLKPSAERRPAVLYIEDFKPGDKPFGEELTESALSDYNRMHAYLITMAKTADALVVTPESPAALSEGAATHTPEKIYTLKEALRKALRLT